MAKYLVTGGCGFIGSHLVDKLLSQDHEVVVLDDLSTGKRENLSGDAEFVQGDVTDYDTVKGIFDRGIDGCFHLAAIASVPKCNEEWVRSHQVNITGTVVMFDCAAKSVRKVPVVYTSSAAIYGDNTNIPLVESEVPAPLTAYGADKLACEQHGKVAWLIHNVPNVGIRPFNIYGPRQDPSSPYSGVISVFANRISQGLPISFFGDGEQVRDFVYVEDLVHIFYVATMGATEGARVFNACTGKSTTLKKLAHVLEDICEKKVEKNFLDARAGDIHKSEGNPTKIKTELQYVPQTELELGLTKLIESLG